jgi:hypothetical protein
MLRNPGLAVLGVQPLCQFFRVLRTVHTGIFLSELLQCFPIYLSGYSKVQAYGPPVFACELQFREGALAARQHNNFFRGQYVDVVATESCLPSSALNGRWVHIFSSLRPLSAFAIHWREAVGEDFHTARHAPVLSQLPLRCSVPCARITPIRRPLRPFVSRNARPTTSISPPPPPVRRSWPPKATTRATSSASPDEALRLYRFRQPSRQ